MHPHNLPRLHFNRRMTSCYLVDDLRIHIDGLDIVVPSDTSSDGASVPRCVQWAVGRWGPHVWAAFAHDYLYQYHSAVAQWCSRADADRILRRVAQADGMHWHTAWLMWCAVRLFGGKYWSKI